MFIRKINIRTIFFIVIAMILCPFNSYAFYYLGPSSTSIQSSTSTSTSSSTSTQTGPSNQQSGPSNQQGPTNQQSGPANQQGPTNQQNQTNPVEVVTETTTDSDSGSTETSQEGESDVSEKPAENTQTVSEPEVNTEPETPPVPEEPPAPVYPDPTDSMSDSQLQEISENGNAEQKQVAEKIIEKREHIKQNDALVAENDKVDTQVDKVSDASETVTEPPLTDPLPDGKNEKIDDVKEEKETKEKVKAAELPENKKKNKKKKQSSNSKKSGDPVKITEGAYEQNDSDFELSGAIDFSIKRRYISSGDITSSFGYGWFTNLDERILLGTDITPEENRQNYLDYSNQIKSTIEEYETQLADFYEVNSIYSAVDVYNNKIAVLQGEVNEAQALLAQTDSLIEAAQGYEALEEIQKVKAKTENLIASLNAKIYRQRQFITDINIHLGRLNRYKTEYQNSLKQIEDYNPIYELSMEHKKKNKYGMFPGMASWYEEIGLEYLTYIDEAGYPHVFSEESTGVWKNHDEKKYLEIHRKDNGYELVQYDGFVKQYDEKGFIQKIVDRNGNWILITRTSDEKIIFIETSDLAKLQFDYSGNFISKITNVRSSDEYVSYGYNAEKLVAVRDTDGDSVEMSYDENKRMISLRKCDGSLVRFEYGEIDSEGNVITTATINEEGFAEHFIYDRNNRHTDYIDHDNNRFSYWYDERHRTVKEMHPDGTVILYEYDDFDNVIKKEINGYVIRNLYDENGNKLQTEYQDGLTERWGYDNYGLLVFHKDRDGITEDYIRDDKGNLLTCKKSGRIIAEQTVKANGLVERTVYYGQKPIVTEYKYDQYNNISSETTGGIKTEYLYDSRNRITKVLKAGKLLTEYKYEKGRVEQKDFNGLVTTCLINGRKDKTDIISKDSYTGEVRSIHIDYDKRHLPLRIYSGTQDNLELIKSCLYSPEGKLEAEIIHGEECWIRLYEYEAGQICGVKQFKVNAKNINLTSSVNKAVLKNLEQNVGKNVYIEKYETRIQGNGGKKVAVTDGSGFTDIFEYDIDGHLIKKTDKKGEVYQTVYSKGGRRISEQALFGGLYEYSYDSYGQLNYAGEKGAARIHTEYYADGNINYTTDRYGRTTYYNYDNLGRVVSVESEERKVWYEYDVYGRIKKEVVGNSNNESDAVYFVTYSYSEDEREVTKTIGGKYTVVNKLDAYRNVVCQLDGNTNKRSYVYNSQNQLIESYDGYGNKTSYSYNALGKIEKLVQPDETVIRYKYNHMGKLISVKDECGTVYEASYGKTGLLEKERYRADSEKSYEYDNAGRVTKVMCGGETVEAYSYGEYGRSFTVKDGNGNDYLYNYDSYGRLVNEKNRAGLEQNYVYDAEGQLKTKTCFDGGTSVIQYSDDRRIRTVRYADGSENQFVYDAIGNLLEMNNVCGKTVYQYDKSGRMIYQKDEVTGEECHFEYDAAGNRVLLETKNLRTSYTYGKNNELTEIFDNKQKTGIKLFYDQNGREVLRILGNGIKEETLYDNAGRVIVKYNKSERGELLWGEGYVYDSLGKHTATVDSQSRITLYEYNKKGQLSAVYYPYSEELSQLLKQESETNGLAVKGYIGENRFLTAEERNAFIPLLNAMQYGLGYNLANLQVMVKESFAYDKNGNRVSKTNNYGKIEYTYDAENYLTASGSRGQSFIKYTYDVKGNLLTEESSVKTAKYAYNAQNRLVYSEVIDKAAKTYAQTNYGYDASGRRVVVQDNEAVAMRTIYDGLSFDVIKQSPVRDNGTAIGTGEPGFQWNRDGRYSGGRYRYLDDENMNDGNRYYYLGEDAYTKLNTRYLGERTLVSLNSRPLVQTTSDGVEYFSTDLLGSAACVTDGYGKSTSLNTYDAFGSLIQGSLKGSTDFGYLSKQYDPSTSFYNYGYRDYLPKHARFTTSDPIRDGSNWFTYCNGDPVNFVDLWGLEVNDKIKIFVYRNKKSYEISLDRNEIKNDSLDVILLYNEETMEYVVFEDVQSVANYPSTDKNGNKVDICFMDTIGTSNFKLKVYTTTDVAEGDAAVITETTTIDGRYVDENGYTENPHSEGRGLIHSDENKDGERYLTKLSKQCFILDKDDNTKFFNALRRWGVEDNTSIKGIVFDTDTNTDTDTDRGEH